VTFQLFGLALIELEHKFGNGALVRC
jgi:hypothetical protein